MDNPGSNLRIEDCIITNSSARFNSGGFLKISGAWIVSIISN